MTDGFLDHGHGEDPAHLPPVFSRAPSGPGDAGGPTDLPVGGRRGPIPDARSLGAGSWAVALFAAVAVVGSAGAVYAVRESLFPSLGAPTTQSVWQNPVPPRDVPPATVVPTPTTTTTTTTTTIQEIAVATTATTASSTSVPDGHDDEPDTDDDPDTGDDQRSSTSAPVSTVDDHGGDDSGSDPDDSSGSGSGSADDSGTSGDSGGADDSGGSGNSGGSDDSGGSGGSDRSGDSAGSGGGDDPDDPDD